MTNVFLEANYLTSEQTIIPISLALVSEDDRFCYIDLYCKEAYEVYNEMTANSLVLKRNLNLDTIDYAIIRNDINNAEIINNSNSRRDVTINIILFLKKYNDVKIISNDASYSWVLFCQLFLDISNLPKKILPCCHNLNQDIAQRYKISDRKALEKNRETIAYGNHTKLLEAKEKFRVDYSIYDSDHNALWKALITKKCYEKTAIDY